MIITTLTPFIRALGRNTCVYFAVLQSELTVTNEQKIASKKGSFA